MRRLALPLLVALLAVLFPATPAAAHARLVGSQPPGGATLAEPPAEVTLEFSERIEASFGGVQVFDPAGARVDAGDAQIAGTSVRVALQPLETPGTYTVAFRIISGDSHPVESRFAFVYQPPTPAPPAEEDAVSAAPEPAPTPAKSLEIELENAGPGTAAGLWVARLVNYLALTAVVGLLVTAGLLLAGDRFTGLQRRLTRLAAAVAVAWALSGAALFVYGLSNAAARGLPQALQPQLAGRFAATRFGYTVLIQAGIAAAVAVLAMTARTRGVALAALAAAGLGAFAPGWWGHAGADGVLVVALASDWTHVLAVTAWAGGLAVLAAVLLRRDADLDVIPPAQRFSRLAGWALAVVVATGVVNALLRISALGQLIDTAWGRLVLIKLGLVAGIAALGYRNRRRMLPHLARAVEPGAARRAFRTLAVAEAVLMVAAFGTATGLASSIPADAEAASRIQSIATAFGDGQINLTVDPATTGPNLVHLYFLDRNGRQREVTEPSLIFTQGAATLDARLLLSGPGHYTVFGQPIPQPGDYQVAVVADVGGERVTATGTVTIRE